MCNVHVHIISVTLSPSLPLPIAITDYFSVNLIKNRSAVEIGHSGQYCLSISTSAIILHWRTMAIAHQWSRRSVVKLYHPRREGHLVLVTRRSAALSLRCSKTRERVGGGRGSTVF